MLKTENPKLRQEQVAKLLVGESVLHPALFRPSTSSIDLGSRQGAPSVDHGRDGDNKKAEDEYDDSQRRDVEKEKEQDEEEKIVRGAHTKPIKSFVAPQKVKSKPMKESNIHFSKENVPSVLPTTASPLSNAIQRRLVKKEERRLQPGDRIEVTVFLPSNEDEGFGQVRFEVDELASAKSLIEAALKSYFDGPEAAPELSTDAGAYRIYIAEEDGEVDTDIPALDEDCTIASSGVQYFALRKKVGGKKHQRMASTAIKGRTTKDRADSDFPEGPVMSTGHKKTENNGGTSNRTKTNGPEENNGRPKINEDYQDKSPTTECCVIS